MPQLYTDNAISFLAIGISAAATSITLPAGDGAKFPSPANGDFAILDISDAGGAKETVWERVMLTSRAGDVLTVVRGVEGSTAAIWPAYSIIDLRVSAKSIEYQVGGKVFYLTADNASFNQTVTQNIFPAGVAGINGEVWVVEGVVILQCTVAATATSALGFNSPPTATYIGTGIGNGSTTGSQSDQQTATGDVTSAAAGLTGYVSAVITGNIWFKFIVTLTASGTLNIAVRNGGLATTTYVIKAGTVVTFRRAKAA